MSLLELYCAVDDFCQAFVPQWRQTLLSLSERMTIIIHFHQSGYRTFKDYYVRHVCEHLRGEFPALVSYARFVELMPQTLVPLMVYLQHCFGACTGIAFVDAPRRWPCVATSVSTSTRSLGASPRVARRAWAGSTASSSTWSPAADKPRETTPPADAPPGGNGDSLRRGRRPPHTPHPARYPARCNASPGSLCASPPPSTRCCRYAWRSTSKLSPPCSACARAAQPAPRAPTPL